MKLFGERGYQGTSFDDLIHAMGISASRLLQFVRGSKEDSIARQSQSYRRIVRSLVLRILISDPPIRELLSRVCFAATARIQRACDIRQAAMMSLACTQTPPGAGKHP